MARRAATKTSTRLRLVMVMVAAIVAAAIAVILGAAAYAALVGLDAAAAVYVTLVALAVWQLDPESSRQHAVREDPGRAASDVILVAASLASLVAVGFVLAASGSASGGARIWLVALGILSVILAWTTIHVLYMLSYARAYYGGTPGGIDFGDTKPNYTDFAYLAFTLGMTFQVSDTNLQTRDIRRIALHHALLSYVFGTVIVATTINLIAGLSK